MLRKDGGISTTSAIVRRVLSLIFEIAALLLFSSYSPAAQSSRDDLVKPPVIDKHDIRFIRLSVNGEAFRGRVNSMVQDDYGFLWFGTSEGLYKYDGYSLQAHRHEPGKSNTPSDDSVTALYKDHDGSLWIGSKAGGLDRLDPSRETFAHYRHDPARKGSLASDDVKCVYRDRSGNWSLFAFSARSS